jgi:hypothetical protein
MSIVYWKHTADGFKVSERATAMKEEWTRIDSDEIRHAISFNGRTVHYTSFCGFDRGPGLQKVLRRLMKGVE